MEKLKNFEELVKDYIGPEKSVVEYNITNLTAPGENYLSEIVKIDAVLKHNGSGAEENLNVVAKLVTDDPLMGKTTTLTENELTFYTKIVPAVKRFHEKHELPYPSFYPDFIGGRLNLNGSDEPDTDAVVVLENLKVQGYTNLDRHVGYDLETIKIVLKDLATFHAAPLAMKLLEPELFETEIKSNCSKPPPQFAPPGDRPGPPGPSGDRPEPPGKMPHPPFLEILLNLFEEKQYLDVAVKLKKFKEQSDYEMKYHPEKMFNRPPVEPFATLTHNDMWINNTMQLIKDGKTIKNKLVDFQMCRLGTPIQDFIFLLFSSVELACLKEHLDDLLKHYYESFADVLRKCDCYGPQFSYEKFVDEIKLQGRHAIGQCIMMCCGVIFAKKGHKVDIKNMETMTKDDMPPLAVEKMAYLCKEATKRDWF